MRFILYITSSLLLIHLSCKVTDYKSTEQFQVGYADRVITPTDIAFIAGHSHNRIFKGINDDIFVKAAIISNDKNKVALLTFDCIGLLHPQLLAIRSIVKEKSPSFPVKNIIMTSTHTHSGPDVVGLWGKHALHSGVDPIYMKELVNKAADAILEADEQKKSCTARYSISTHGHDWVYNISEPEELDRSLTVLRFENDKKSLLTLTNFACHPTFLDAVNDNVSSDYVGGYYKKMAEEQEGGNMFIQGSIGGWVQPEHEEKSHSQAFYRGAELAEKVISILENGMPIKGSNIHVKTSIFTLPLENLGFVMLSEAGVLDRDFSDSVSTEVAYFEIGNAAFATHPGETVPELSIRTKELMTNNGPKFIIGLGMDALGYILKPYFFQKEKEIPHSEYLCSVSVGPETQEYIYQELEELILEK